MLFLIQTESRRIRQGMKMKVTGVKPKVKETLPSKAEEKFVNRDLHEHVPSSRSTDIHHCPHVGLRWEREGLRVETGISRNKLEDLVKERMTLTSFLSFFFYWRLIKIIQDSIILIYFMTKS